jgi:hypothetical protein
LAGSLPHHSCVPASSPAGSVEPRE